MPQLIFDAPAQRLKEKKKGWSPLLGKGMGAGSQKGAGNLAHVKWFGLVLRPQGSHKRESVF